MDATEAQLKFGASLTNSVDNGAGSAVSGPGPSSGGSGAATVGTVQQHAPPGTGSGGGHLQMPAPYLASLAALG